MIPKLRTRVRFPSPALAKSPARALECLRVQQKQRVLCSRNHPIRAQACNSVKARRAAFSASRTANTTSQDHGVCSSPGLIDFTLFRCRALTRQSQRPPRAFINPERVTGNGESERPASVGVGVDPRRVGDTDSWAGCRRPTPRATQKCLRVGALDDHELLCVLS